MLEVTDLAVSYTVGGRTRTAVDGASFSVERGEVVAIVGESGSGKSTTAHAVLRLLARNATVDAGSIRFAGEEVSRLSARQWRAVRGRRIGLIPQDPATSLNPVKRVGPQVAEPLVIHGIASRRAAEQQAVELLRLAGIPEPEARAQQFPHQFSGGMTQRALIATALAAEPDLVIADEPTSALDVTVQQQILDHIDGLSRRLGTAVLLITHDLAVASDRAHRIVVMQHGRIVEQGPTAAVLGDPRHPYTRALIDAAPGLRSAPIARVPRRQPDDAQPLLELTGVSKEFALPGRRTLRAVDDVSLTVGRGETLAIVGESGSGKSTTARLALRLETPTSGRIRFDGIDLGAADAAEVRAVRRRLQLVYQNPFASLDPRFTIEQVIDEPLRAFREGDRPARAARVRELLDQVALPSGVATRRPAELSGGQRQRVAIARALALRPDLVVLDEAVSALDVSVQAQVLALLTEIQDATGVSYLFISHDLAVVREISDRVAVMSAGRVVELGTASQVLTDPRDPYTRRLLAAVPGRRSGSWTEATR
ncbi:ABC transporter ATP-binding protein [Microbacterium sp. EYE_5]|nr:ABC transporter ATP-binding protein [Microbacterium sp. EYE_382]MCK6085280.1 ABC transporter ATP-binding protein [Microbacterium sp. EYE_384]MCK6122495.1 ABC transporter ATP-binding protein [Microbacterium sp. EYE_80]MCK6126043.1 ABC transporter ATP-binding protein [Microbacterium sp. EYE_79]MCK6140964.1 ABC transporter ATP-binding protein [Microbacterium sp. EYE_39]MCK6217690.1 ABC transporter ATP-binding protein [Microbacterium sp. EYE_5]MCK6226826.1 ABC transporter ATP-binding protein [